MAIDPLGMTAMGSALSSSPSAMIAPFPNCFSMPATMVRMARSFSARSNMEHFLSGGWILISRNLRHFPRTSVEGAVENASLDGLRHVDGSQRSDTVEVCD